MLGTVNNQLQIILGYSQLMEKYLDDHGWDKKPAYFMENIQIPEMKILGNFKLSSYTAFGITSKKGFVF